MNGFLHGEPAADAGRISRMEDAMDLAARAARALSDALDGWEAAQAQIAELSGYLGSGEWHADREADGRGMLPDGLRRGVLSEDAAYDVLAECDEARERLRAAAK